MQNENQSRSRNASDSTQSSDVYIGRTADDQTRDAAGAGETTQLESVSPSANPDAREVNTPIVVQLREEELGAQKQWVEAGAVRVRKR